MATKVKAKEKLVLMNVPELAPRAPDFEEVQGVFAGAANQVWAQTALRLVFGRLAEARLLKEAHPDLPPDQAKYWDGAANCANELATDLLRLLRGEGDKIDKGVREAFPVKVKNHS